MTTTLAPVPEAFPLLATMNEADLDYVAMIVDRSGAHEVARMLAKRYRLEFGSRFRDVESWVRGAAAKHSMITTDTLRERALASGWSWGPGPNSWDKDFPRWNNDGQGLYPDKSLDPAEAFRHKYATSVPCHECGHWVEMDTSSSRAMREAGECFRCHFSAGYVARANEREIVRVESGGTIVHYVIVSDRGSKESSGHGGARFDIVFNDGRKVTTHNLWYQGTVPAHFAARLPANARFDHS